MFGMAMSRRDLLKSVLAAGLGVGVGVSTHGYFYERHRLRLTSVELPVAGLPPALDGFRIGFLTDLHHSELVPQSDIARAVDMVNARRPDLIVLGGDYVSHADSRYVEPCAEALEALEAPLGVVAVIGNHDDERTVPAALRRRKFTVLKDARTTILARGEPLDLVGVRFWTREAEEIRRIAAGAKGTTLLLAHDPRRLVQAAEIGIPAVLAGHTHGGQVVLPGLGAIAARRFPIVSGLGERRNTSIFVSRGVGTVYIPLRINCPPEVAIVTLTRRPQG
jgi:uncharacterized protein